MQLLQQRPQNDTVNAMRKGFTWHEGQANDENFLSGNSIQHIYPSRKCMLKVLTYDLMKKKNY